jgi:hypothetical protein
VKPNNNSVEVHPQLSHKNQPVNRGLVGAGFSFWPLFIDCLTVCCTIQFTSETEHTKTGTCPTVHLWKSLEKCLHRQLRTTEQSYSTRNSFKLEIFQFGVPESSSNMSPVKCNSRVASVTQHPPVHHPKKSCLEIFLNGMNSTYP